MEKSKLQQDQADQAYNYILKKITESDILEKTDVNHLISELKEKYSIFKELTFVIIVRAWYSSDCHVQLINIPKFSRQNDLLEGKTESPQISDSMESIDKISSGGDLPEKSIDKTPFISDEMSIDKISNSQQKSLISSTKSIDKIDPGSDIESIDKTPIDPFDSKLQVLTNQKSIQIRYRTCGKKTCKCTSKREKDMHGPYIYKIEWDPQRKKQIWKYQGKYKT